MTGRRPFVCPCKDIAGICSNVHGNLVHPQLIETDRFDVLSAPWGCATNTASACVCVCRHVNETEIGSARKVQLDNLDALHKFQIASRDERMIVFSSDMESVSKR